MTTPKLPEPWRIERDTQECGKHWRNLLVIGPGVMTDERRYYLTFNTKRDAFKENECLQYVRRQDKHIVRRIGEYVRSTRPTITH